MNAEIKKHDPVELTIMVRPMGPVGKVAIANWLLAQCQFTTGLETGWIIKYDDDDDAYVIA